MERVEATETRGGGEKLPPAPGSHDPSNESQRLSQAAVLDWLVSRGRLVLAEVSAAFDGKGVDHG